MEQVSNKETLIDKARDLGPQDRAVLVILTEYDNAGPDIVIEDHRGGDWWQILGILGAGSAFAQSEMKL